MPELPEVETIRQGLQKAIVGKKIKNIEVREPKIFQGDRKKAIGRTIRKIERRGKMIIIKIDEDLNLVCHLKLTGQLIYGEKAGTILPGKHTHVIFDLENGAKLFFNDLRRFGWIKVLTEKELAKSTEKLGPEPFNLEFTPEYLKDICLKWGRPIKLLLMEQSKISGIGNIYANEVLWCAKISPLKRARDLAHENPEKLSVLYHCLQETVKTGLKYGGSSAKDEAFVNAFGEKGRMQEHFQIYQQNGKPCPRCTKTIRVSRLAGRGTFFCPNCQK